MPTGSGVTLRSMTRSGLVGNLRYGIEGFQKLLGSYPSCGDAHFDFGMIQGDYDACGGCCSAPGPW